MTTFSTPGGKPCRALLNRSPEDIMLVKAPIRLPDGWLDQFGYQGGRRLVALYWSPLGDEACYDDGISSACGMSDNWLYLAFKRQPPFADWLHGNDIRLGDSEREAKHWLIADATTGDLFAAPWREASEAVRTQTLPPESAVTT